MAQTSTFFEIFDEMEETVCNLLHNDPHISVDELYVSLVSTGGHRCIMLEKGWRLSYYGGHKTNKPYQKLAHKKGFRVFAWNFLTSRAKAGGEGFTRENETVFVIVKC